MFSTTDADPGLVQQKDRSVSPKKEIRRPNVLRGIEGARGCSKKSISIEASSEFIELGVDLVFELLGSSRFGNSDGSRRAICL